MANRELREWLGLTLADLLVAGATLAVMAMYFANDATVDLILAVVAVLLTVAACPLGMKRDPSVSGFTNAVKVASYPSCVLLAVGAIAVHYAWFSRG